MTTVQDYLNYPGNANINPYMLQYTSPSEDIYVSNKVSQDLINNYNKVMNEEEDYSALLPPLEALKQELKKPVSKSQKSTTSTPKATNEIIRPSEKKEEPAQMNSTATETSGWVNIYKNNKDKWIADMTAAYKKYGLSDNAIKNLIAKNALESGWGKSAQGDFNFGNLTTGANWTGRYVQGRDTDGKGNRISQKFRAYDSLEDYVADEIQFLTRLYDFNKDDDFETFIGKLQGNNSGKRRYAGVSDYADRVRRVYNSI